MAMITPNLYAIRNGVAYSTVMKWLRTGQIKGAKKVQLPKPLTGHIYQVPEDAPRPTIKPGPVAGKDAKR